GMLRVEFVRFADFAAGRGKAAAEAVESAQDDGLLAPVGEATKAVDEMRLLTERIFYEFKREPLLLRWQIEALSASGLALPEAQSTLEDIHRLREQIEKLPKNVADEREAILAGFDERLKATNSTISGVTATLAQAEKTARSIDSMSSSLNEAVKSTD